MLLIISFIMSFSGALNKVPMYTLVTSISPTMESGYPCKVCSSAGSNVIGVKFNIPKINAKIKPSR